MINYNFIARQFEGVSLHGYVPPLDGGKIESGVTIAGGFDIGQHSKAELMSGLEYSLAQKLSIYCGVTGRNALTLLDEKPLEITQDECSEINEFAHKAAAAKLLDDWGRYTNVSFESVTNEAQTVIASVAFQYGNLPSQCPMFWKQAVTQNWESMLRNLWNFGDDYETRRRQEYILLLWGMTK